MFLFLSLLSVALAVIDPKITVSGISSGGYMAVQMHVAYSGNISGCGVFAGGPFYCAQANMGIALTACMSTPAMINLNTLYSYTDSQASSHGIDPTSNLAQSKAFLFSGTKDTTVNPGVMKALQTYYTKYGVSLKSEFSLNAAHSMVTDDYGNACTTSYSPYINNCNYAGAGQMFTALFGTPMEPRVNASNLLTFDQSKYTPKSPSSISMNAKGYVYLPSACQDAKTSTVCKVHVAFHGCLQYLDAIGETFVQHAGYNGWAEANNIIVIYPQTIAAMLMSNPNGCWDWFGYTGGAYATKNGPQMQAVKAMIDAAVANHGHL